MNITFRIIDMDIEQVKDTEMIIHLSGLTIDGKSVYCQVLGYQPYYFLELPCDINWTGPKLGALRDYIINKISECPPDVLKFEIKKLCLYSVNRPILRINFKTEDSARHLKNLLRFEWKVEGFEKSFPPNSFKLHEDNIPTLVKYIIERKFESAGWVSVKPIFPKGLPKDYSTCDYSIYTKPSNISKSSEISAETLVDPKVCSFDVEEHSKNRKSASPKPELPENLMTMISLVFGRLSQPLEEWTTYVITLYVGNKKPDKKHKAIVIDCKGSEKLLIVNFIKLIKQEKPDIFTGYNINQFDWLCILTRAELIDGPDYGPLTMHLDKKERLKKVYGPLALRLFKMGKLKNTKGRLCDLSWTSSARGKQVITYIKSHGIFNFDIYPEIRFNHTLPTYKLSFVAKHFLGDEENKEDMPYQQMFAIFDMVEVLERNLENVGTGKTILTPELAKKLIISKTTPEELLTVDGMTNHVADFYKALKKVDTLDGIVDTARGFMLLLLKYVIQDARICPALMKFLNSLTSLWESANVCKSPASYIYEKGQQIKVLAQYAEQAYNKNYVVPFYKNTSDTLKLDEDEEDDGKKNYQGATVLKVKKGLYKNIVVLDFAGLYPSIMMAKNICHSTLVPLGDKTPDDQCNVAKWSEHIRCSHDPEKRKKKKNEKVYCGDHCYRFRKHNGRDEEKGLLPLLLEHLKKARDAAKGQLKIEQGKWKAFKAKELDGVQLTEEEKKEMSLASRKSIVLDARQMALKCQSNSSYGFLGAPKGYFPLLEGAASVTYYGRESISKAISLVEEKYPECEVIYGDTDSIFVDFHETDLKIIFEKGHTAEKYITSHFPKEMRIEMEKVCKILLLKTKKKYSYSLMDEQGRVYKEESKGDINKRRDNCDAARKIYSLTENLIKNYIPQDETLYEINNKILDIYRGLVPLHNFIIYKGLKQLVEEYKNCTGHVLFAKRLEERGNVMGAGTRLEYVFIKKRGKDLKSGEKMEDWGYFLMNRQKDSLQIDYGYYVEHNILKPTTEILNIAYPAPEKQFYKPEDNFKRAMDVYLKPKWRDALKSCSIDYKAKFIAKHSKKKVLREAAKTFYARFILDKLYKQHKLKKRTAHIPKRGSSIIFLNDRVIQQICDFHYYWNEVLYQILSKSGVPDWVALRWEDI